MTTTKLTPAQSRFLETVAVAGMEVNFNNPMTRAFWQSMNALDRKGVIAVVQTPGSPIAKIELK